MTENTVAISESELDDLRERAREAERSTRERSIAKPQDHKPAGEDMISLDHKGVTYEFRKRALTNLYVLDMLERQQLTQALRKILGDEKFEAFLESIDDGTGYADPEEAGKLLEAIGERAGAKN